MSYTYDRRTANNFEFTLSAGGRHTAKVFVNAKQLGLITWIETRSHMRDPLPKIRIGVLDGFRREAWDASSEQVRESALRTVRELRTVPGVEIVCPDYLR